MDFTTYNAEELHALYNLLLETDAYLYDMRLPEDTASVLYEFALLDKADREVALQDLEAQANFVAYANKLGNEDMVNALMKVANDMAKMSKYELKPIEMMPAQEVEKIVDKKSLDDISFPSVQTEEKQTEEKQKEE